MRALPLASLLVVVAASSPALADVEIATSAPPVEKRFDLRLGLLTGGADLGDVTGPSSGVHATAGYRHGLVTVMAEYSYLHVGDAESDRLSRDGNMTRGGAVVRYQLADVAKLASPIGMQFWVEGGVGFEHVTWQRGGVLERPDLALGFGFELDGRGWRRSSTSRPRHFGGFVGFRALMARAPDGDDPVMCEGPCTTATPPSRNDVSFFFHFGLHWGR